MSQQFWLTFFGWCSIINLGILIWWSLFILMAPQWVYSLHTRWFELKKSHFYAIHYAGIMMFKLLWFIFNLAPYLAIKFALP